MSNPDLHRHVWAAKTFSLFQIPLDNIMDNIFGFMDIDHMSPSEVKSWSWWEFEGYVKRLNDRIERDNKQQKDQAASHQNVPDYSKKIPNMNSMNSMIGKFKS